METIPRPRVLTKDDLDQADLPEEVTVALAEIAGARRACWRSPSGSGSRSWPPDFTVPYPSGDLGDLEPNIGDIGNGKIDATSFFSGWRGSRRLDADTLAEPDQYYLPEAGDPAFATGFGDVDVHEVATGRGPDADLAYFAH